MLAFVVGVLVGSGVTILAIGFFAALIEEDEKRQAEAHARKIREEHDRQAKNMESWYRGLY